MVLFERISRNGSRASAAARAVLSALAATAALMLWAAAAHAGRYHVYSCRMPDGGAAPADGWQGSAAADSAIDTYEIDSCGEDGALVAALGEEGGHVAAVDQARWTFQAPSWDRLVGGSLRRAAYLHGNPGDRARYEYWVAGPTEASVVDGCSFASECVSRGLVESPMAEVNAVTLAAGSGTGVYVAVACGPGPIGSECGDDFADRRGFAAAAFVFAADLVLEQEVDPEASDVGGELASAGSVSGTSDVSFTASDHGSGVYEAVFSVDGQVVQRTVLNEDGGRCRNVGQTSDGLAAFLYVQPCPSSVSADVGFESSLVGNGAHHLVVSVIDAAGNSATVLDRQITVDNPGAPGPANGVNASAHASLTVGWAGTSTRRLSTRYGRRHDVVGKLAAPGGAPIGGAMIEVAAAPASVGGATAAVTTAHTDSQGRFLLVLPARLSSRTLRFAYRSHVRDAAPAATATLTLSVRAGVVLSISPRTASVGRSIRFEGRLLGGPVPRAGKLLVLEARAPGGRWIEFDDVRTNARGVYRASYRFKFPGPASYQFRVLSEPESDYPYAQGTSNTVNVAER